MSRFDTTPDVLLNLLSKEGMSVEELKNLLKLEGADPELLLKYFNEGKVIKEIKALLGNCFVAGTKVLTTAGEKNIENIQIGDWVIADDPTTPGGIEPRQVLDTYVRHTNELFDLYVDGEVISTTGEHPFWAPDQGWVKAKDLQIGTTLQTEDGSIIDVDGVARREGDFTVYNLKVDDFHTYYVSDLEILVHNANYGGRIPPPDNLPAFPNAQRAKAKTPVQGGGNLRKRWKERDGTIYEWDYQHGAVEKYNKRGIHQGEFDHVTGDQLKPADPTRRVDP